MDEEQDDIYFDLPQYDLGNEIAKLRTENDAYKTKITDLETQIASLQTELNQLREVRDREKDIFLVNISELYKTAKAETDRKDRMIGELRRQLDNVIFRRDRGNFQHKRPRDEERGEPNEEVASKRLKENIPVVEESRQQQEKQESDGHHEKDAKLDVVKDVAPKNERRPRSRSREGHRKRNNGERERSRSKSRDRKKDRHRDDRQNGAYRGHHKREISPTSHRSTPEALRHIYHKNGRKTSDNDRSTRHETDTQRSSTREHCDSKHHDGLSAVDTFKGHVVVDDDASAPKKSDKSAKDRVKTSHDKSRSNSSSSKRSQKSDSNTKPDGSKKDDQRSDRPNEKAVDSSADLRQKLDVLKDNPKDKTDHREVKEDRLMERKGDHRVAGNEKTCHTETKRNNLENNYGTKANRERSSPMKLIRRSIKKKSSPKKQTTVQRAFASLKIQRGRMKRDEKCSDVLNNGEVKNVEEKPDSFEEGEIIEEPEARRVEETITEQKSARLDDHKGTSADKEQSLRNVEEPKDKRTAERGVVKKRCSVKLEEYKRRRIKYEMERSRIGEQRGETVEEKLERLEERTDKIAVVTAGIEGQHNERTQADGGKDEEKLRETLEVVQNDRKVEECETVKEQKVVRAEECQRKEGRKGERSPKRKDRMLSEQKGGTVDERESRQVEEQKGGRVKEQKGGRRDEFERRQKTDGISPKQKDGRLEEQKGRRTEEQKRRKVEELQGAERVKDQRNEGVEKRKDDNIEKRQETSKEEPKQEIMERKESNKKSQKLGADNKEDYLDTSTIEALLAQRKFELEMLQKKSEKEIKNSPVFGNLNSTGGFASQVVGVPEKSEVEKKAPEENAESTKEAKQADEGRIRQAPTECRSQGQPRPEEKPKVTRPKEKPKMARSVDGPRVSRPEEKPKVARPAAGSRVTKYEEKPRVIRPQEKPKSAFRRNLEAVTKHLFTTAESERNKPEVELPSEIAPAAPPEQTIIESILVSKDTSDSADRRLTKSLFDTPCKTSVDAGKSEFREPKKDRRKSDPVIAIPHKSNDDPGQSATIMTNGGVDDEEPPRRVLRSQTKAMRASPNATPMCSSPIKRPDPDKSQQKSHVMLFQDLNLSDVNPDNLLTYDLSHDGAIPCLHISDSFNNVHLEQFVDMARGFDNVVASTPLLSTAEQQTRRAQQLLRDDLATTSSSSDSKLATPDVVGSSQSTMVQDAQIQSSQPTFPVPGSNVSTVRRRRRCIVTLVD